MAHYVRSEPTVEPGTADRADFWAAHPKLAAAERIARRREAMNERTHVSNTPPPGLELRRESLRGITWRPFEPADPHGIVAYALCLDARTNDGVYRLVRVLGRDARFRDLHFFDDGSIRRRATLEPLAVPFIT